TDSGWNKAVFWTATSGGGELAMTSCAVLPVQRPFLCRHKSQTEVLDQKVLDQKVLDQKVLEQIVGWLIYLKWLNERRCQLDAEVKGGPRCAAVSSCSFLIVSRWNGATDLWLPDAPDGVLDKWAKLMSCAFGESRCFASWSTSARISRGRSRSQCW